MGEGEHFVYGTKRMGPKDIEMLDIQWEKKNQEFLETYFMFSKQPKWDGLDVTIDYNNQDNRGRAMIEQLAQETIEWLMDYDDSEQYKYQRMLETYCYDDVARYRGDDR